MFSYEFYKVFHLTSIVILLTSLAICFFHPTPPRFLRWITGLGTFFTLVGGMGLLARIGISHTSGWPTWVYLKVVIWLIIGVGGAIIVKRRPQWGIYSYPLMLLLFVVAAVLANLKIGN